MTDDSNPNDDFGANGLDQNGDGRGNGLDANGAPSRLHVLGDTEFSHAERIELIEGTHAFPGLFPIVIIAANDAEFHMTLESTVAAEQGEAPFRIRRRVSSEGHYASYKIEIHVESAEVALARQAVLAALPGIRALL